VDQDGLFEVDLGRWVEIDPLQWPDDLEIWLGIGYNQEFLTPRVPLRAVPFAYFSRETEMLDGMTVHQFSHRRMILHTATRNVNNVIMTANTPQQLLSIPYYFDYNTWVDYYAYVGAMTAADLNEGRCTILLELLDANLLVVASTLVTAAANPGSPQITGHAADIPAGTYYVRATITNTHAVTYQGYELGTVWQGEVVQR
jgi:hypothetical protein